MSKQKKISHQANECKPSFFNILLADVIFLFHCLIILFVILAPLTNIPAILILHITFAVCLMVHWHANSNVCSLSLLESHLRGINSREDTFTHQFIAPIYDISSTEWSNFVWFVTFIVMCVSIYKLYHTDKFKEAWKCYSEMESESTFYGKFSQTLECFKPLFII